MYTAIVHKIPPADRFPLQYLISDMSPEIQNTSPVFVYYPEKEIFDFSDNNGSVKLAGKIIKAIKDYCSENDIPFIKV